MDILKQHIGHYIDADKLIALIDAKLEDLGLSGSVWVGRSVLQDLKNNIITSLQQEMLETSNNLVDVDAVRDDFMTEVYRVLDADPTNDRANAIINAFDSLPTISQEQPEVDLEKIEKASYKVFPAKKKLGVEKIKYPNREDENFSKREIWKDGVIWAIYSLNRNVRKED